MTSPSAPASVSDGLAAALAPVLGAPVDVTELRKLTGGASRETWSFTAAGEDLIVRRDPPGRPGHPGTMRREADAMRACTRAGLRVPEVLLDDDGSHLGTPGLVMRRVPGETIARRILRDDEFAAARRLLVPQLAEFLAGLHAIEPAEVPGTDTPDPMAIWDKYQRLDQRSSVFDKAHDWLRAHRPAHSTDALIHGDLRLGNVIVDREGLAAVIDWELVHRGDPHEDLAWLCLKAWRFGLPLEVGGVGTLDELLAAYEAAGGRPIDRDVLRWWLVAKTFTWGVGCMLQADTHLSGRVRSVDLAAVGRRTAEQEWDLIELLAPAACASARAAPPASMRPDDDDRYGRPTARELLDTVQEFLSERVAPDVDGGLAYEARVAANVLAIVGRELAQAPADRSNVGTGDDWNALALLVRDRLAVASPKHLTLGPTLRAPSPPER
jgi:aminoglycoside phosphotransferase (APT) family kinase protein